MLLMKSLLFRWSTIWPWTACSSSYTALCSDQDAIQLGRVDLGLVGKQFQCIDLLLDLSQQLLLDVPAGHQVEHLDQREQCPMGIVRPFLASEECKPVGELLITQKGTYSLVQRLLVGDGRRCGALSHDTSGG